MNRADLLKQFENPTPVLDHGFVRLVDVMGSDADIDDAARVSYDKDGDLERTDEARRKLLRFLMRHRHTTPFEQATIKLEIKMPIFVARQLIRHRTQSVNEISGRYAKLPDEFYIPKHEHVCFQSTTNGQGRSGPIEEDDAVAFVSNLHQDCTRAFEMYEANLKDGIALETSRFVLPLNTYTRWVCTWNVHNLLHMLGLRMDSHAQWEIQQFANAIGEIVKAWLPMTWEAFEDYRFHAVTLSRYEVEAVRELLAVHAGDTVLDQLRSSGVEDRREQKDFLSTFVRPRA